MKHATDFENMLRDAKEAEIMERTMRNMANFTAEFADYHQESWFDKYGLLVCALGLVAAGVITSLAVSSWF